MEKVLVYGLGLSGKSTAKALYNKGYEIYVLDEKIEQILENDSSLKGIIKGIVNNTREIDELNPDMVVKSPGIPPSNKIIQYLNSKDYKIRSDLGLVNDLFPNRKTIAVTGTNGKTTTVSLIGHVLKEQGIKSHVIGNIGVGMLEALDKGDDDDIYVIEVSSFQLEDTVDFSADISAILNIRPDHIDWHGSYEEYVKAKLKIEKGSDLNSLIVLNKDDEVLENTAFKSMIKYFSINDTRADYYFKDGFIHENLQQIISLADIKIKGEHNIENILAATAILKKLGLENKDIESSYNSFTGVEHRIEFVGQIKGVRYYNDSKGTNVDASVKALNAFDEPIILLAGGYDKDISYDEYINSFKKNVKEVYLMGQTSQQIYDRSKELGINIPMNFVDSMEEAIVNIKKTADEGDVVLLSPASASWGMYDNFEQRGDHFKQLIKEI